MVIVKSRYEARTQYESIFIQGKSHEFHYLIARTYVHTMTEEFVRLGYGVHMFNVKQFSLNTLSGFQISIVLLPVGGRRGCIQDGPNISASKTPKTITNRIRRKQLDRTGFMQAGIQKEELIVLQLTLLC